MKYSGGRPGRSGHVRCHQVDTDGIDGISTSCVVLYVQWLDISVRKADDRYRSLFKTPGTEQRETTVGHRPRVSTICLPDVIAHDQISQAGLPPPYFIVEYWWWERPGNEASLSVLM